MFDMFKSKITLWSEYAATCTDLFFREAILELFIPFKVSMRRVGFNMNCIATDGEDTMFATSSCKYWARTPSWNRPMGYELWFLAAFPDVAAWAEEIPPYLNELFKYTPDDEMMQEVKGIRRLRIPVLKKIVQAYIDITHKKLETV